MSTSLANSFEAQELLRVLEITRQLAAPCELGTLLTQVIDAGREILSAERGTIFLYDPTAHELYSTVATGATQIRFSVEKGIAGQCARTRKTINVQDCYADPRFNPDIDRKTGYHTRCLIAVPLIGLEDELVGVLQLLNTRKPCFDANDERLADILASQAAAAIQRAQLLETRMVKLKLERDLALARQIQLGVLPKELPTCVGYDLAAFNQPAEETGGDIYDVVSLNHGDLACGNGLLFLLADATGHGIGPALSVTQARAMLRMALRLGASLDDVCKHINRQLADDLSASRFVTAFLGVLDPQRHEVKYHAAGQGPLLHFLAADKTCRYLPASTLPMGIMADPPMETPAPIALGPGDLLVLLTDGFYEYQNAQGQQMGQDRIGAIVTENRHRPAEQILSALLDATLVFASGAPQLDDLTAIVVKRL